MTFLCGDQKVQAGARDLGLRTREIPHGFRVEGAATRCCCSVPGRFRALRHRDERASAANRPSPTWRG